MDARAVRYSDCNHFSNSRNDSVLAVGPKVPAKGGYRVISVIGQKLFSLTSVYALTGVVLWVFSAMTLSDRANKRRISSALFWAILGAIFVFAGAMPHWLTGVL